MRRVLFSLVVVGVVFAIAYGAAAALTVNGGVVQAGSDTTLTCDTTGVTVSYQVVFGGTPPAFRVSQVQVSGIDNACQGLNLYLVLTGAGGSRLGFCVLGTSTTASCSMPDPKVEDVHDVHVAIWKGGATVP